MEFLYGIGMGVAISLCFSFGPAFFTLVRLSVQHGFRKVLPFVFGVNFDDIVQVLLLTTVLSGVDMEAILARPMVAWSAGVVLAILGVWTFLRRAEEGERTEGRVRFQSKGGDTKPWAYWLSGFFINFINPGIWLYWLGIITLSSGKFGVEGSGGILYFAGVLFTTLSLDILKCRAACGLRRVLTPRHIKRFNQMVGVILIGFGVYLVVSMLMGK